MLVESLIVSVSELLRVMLFTEALFEAAKKANATKEQIELKYNLTTEIWNQYNKEV